MNRIDRRKNSNHFGQTFGAATDIGDAWARRRSTDQFEYSGFESKVDLERKSSVPLPNMNNTIKGKL